jgi:hypothetical protein
MPKRNVRDGASLRIRRVRLRHGVVHRLLLRRGMRRGDGDERVRDRREFVRRVQWDGDVPRRELHDRKGGPLRR